MDNFPSVILKALIDEARAGRAAVAELEATRVALRDCEDIEIQAQALYARSSLCDEKGQWETLTDYDRNHFRERIRVVR